MLHAPLFTPTANLDISSLLKSSSPSPPPRTSHPALARSISVPTSSSHVPPASSPSTSTGSHISTSTAPPNTYTAPPQQLQPLRPSGPTLPAPAPASSSISKRPPPAAPHPSASPAKKQNAKWAPDEDALIISLRGSGMKWEDISKRLPGRSVIACRLHYQNYLERRAPWDEEKKDKLARLYDRFKPELWGQLATELGVPWRSAEAMHWALGEQEMARRAGAVRFTMASSNNANPANVSSSSSTSGVEASGYGPPELTTGVYGAGGGIEITAARASEERESRDGRRQRRPASVQLMQGQQLAPVGQGMEFGQGGHGVVLPSLAELTGGVPAFAGFGRERRHREGSDQGRRLPERDSAVQQPGQREAKGERRGGRERLGSEEREVDEQGQESSRRR